MPSAMWPPGPPERCNPAAGAHAPDATTFFGMVMPVWVPIFFTGTGYWRDDPYQLNPSSAPYPGLR
jgi:hypothetical protein